MFWSVFSDLCFEHGSSPNAVAKEIGISSGALTSWKNGATPRASTIKRIADYFGVPVETFPKGKGANREPSGFYKTYVDLCKEHGEKPYSLPLKLGLKSNSAVTQWENGSIPRPATLKKIADYFGVTVGFLLEGDVGESGDSSETSASGEPREDIPAEALPRDDIKFALFGEVDGITDEMMEEVRSFAEFVRQREERKRSSGK